MEPNPRGYNYETSFTPKTQAILQERGQKDCKSHRFREFTVSLCLLEVWEATDLKSHQNETKHELKKGQQI